MGGNLDMKQHRHPTMAGAFDTAWNLLKSNVYNAAVRSNLPAYHPAISGLMERRYLTQPDGAFDDFEPSDISPDEVNPFARNLRNDMRTSELTGHLQRQSVPDVMRYVPDAADDREVDAEALNRLVREASPTVPTQQFLSGMYSR